jgi:hypothetical protein
MGSKLTVTQVVQGRIEYAAEQAAARRKASIDAGERAARYASRGEYHHAQEAAQTATQLKAEADMWEQCSRELLQPVALYLEVVS